SCAADEARRAVLNAAARADHSLLLCRPVHLTRGKRLCSRWSPRVKRKCPRAVHLDAQRPQPGRLERTRDPWRTRSWPRASSRVGNTRVAEQTPYRLPSTKAIR
ncbi:hypothetical protein T492DRAFT_923062, partial [Pavlovales sp. CCMP2436]